MISGNVNRLFKRKIKDGIPGCSSKIKNTKSTEFYVNSVYMPENSHWQIIEYRFYSPAPDKSSAQQINYITDFIHKAESAIVCKNAGDSSYDNFIYVKSFIDLFIIFKY